MIEFIYIIVNCVLMMTFSQFVIDLNDLSIVVNLTFLTKNKERVTLYEVGGQFD